MRRAAGRVAKSAVVPVLGTAAIVGAAWAYTESTASVYVQPLPTMLKNFGDTWFFAHFSSDLLPSVMHVLAGFVIAVVVGVGLGVLLGSSRTLRLMAEPVISLLRSVPVPALVPPAAVAFGLGDDMRIGVIALGCLWPIVLNTMDGVGEIDPLIVDTARSYRINGARRLFWVTLPALGPRIAGACRISLSIGLLAMVISESIAASSGIGFFLLNSQNLFRIDWMWAAILMLGLLGIVLNLGLTAIERRWLRWYFRAQAAAN
jgi:ABC-type nitrate/sulfonate/bicarbonate transport system permease component